MIIDIRDFLESTESDLSSVLLIKNCFFLFIKQSSPLLSLSVYCIYLKRLTGFSFGDSFAPLNTDIALILTGGFRYAVPEF